MLIIQWNKCNFMCSLISVFTLFYLILENMSTNVRKFIFPCYIWHLWRRVWLVHLSVATYLIISLVLCALHACCVYCLLYYLSLKVVFKFYSFLLLEGLIKISLQKFTGPSFTDTTNYKIQKSKITYINKRKSKDNNYSVSNWLSL